MTARSPAARTTCKLSTSSTARARSGGTRQPTWRAARCAAFAFGASRRRGAARLPACAQRPAVYAAQQLGRVAGRSVQLGGPVWVLRRPRRRLLARLGAHQGDTFVTISGVHFGPDRFNVTGRPPLPLWRHRGLLDPRCRQVHPPDAAAGLVRRRDCRAGELGRGRRLWARRRALGHPRNKVRRQRGLRARPRSDRDLLNGQQFPTMACCTASTAPSSRRASCPSPAPSTAAPSCRCTATTRPTLGWGPTTAAPFWRDPTTKTSRSSRPTSTRRSSSARRSPRRWGRWSSTSRSTASSTSPSACPGATASSFTCLTLSCRSRRPSAPRQAAPP